MEPTVTVESASILQMILSSGLFGVIALPLSILMLIGGVIGLLVNKAKAPFYIWILGTLIKFNLFSCALIFAFGITKFGQLIGPRIPVNYEASFIAVLIDMVGGVALILFVTFIAFIAKTTFEIKQKYQCQPIK